MNMIWLNYMKDKLYNRLYLIILLSTKYQDSKVLNALLCIHVWQVLIQHVLLWKYDINTIGITEMWQCM